MNKILKLSLLSLLAFPVLTGCEDKAKKAKSEAKEAFTQISVAYSGMASSEGLGLAGLGLVESYTTQNGYEFHFTYSVAPLAGKSYDIEYVKVNQELMVLEVEIPTFAELNGGTDSEEINYAAYTLTGVANYNNKEVSSMSWNIRVNAEKQKPTVQTIADAKATRKEGETVITYGYVYGYHSYDSNHFYTGVYIANGADGMMLYAGKISNYLGVIDIGDLVMVIGKAAPYDGLFEVKPDSIKVIDHDIDGVSKPVVTTLTGIQYKALSSVKAGNFIRMENLTLTSDIADKTEYPKGSHWELKAKDESDNTITIYVNYHIKNAVMEEIRQMFADNAGKKFNITGSLGWHSGGQITPIIYEKGKTASMSFEFVA